MEFKRSKIFPKSVPVGLTCSNEIGKDEQKAIGKEVSPVSGGIFWILLILLAGSIAVRYVWLHAL